MIAKLHKSDNASQFGIRRDEYFPGRTHTLALEGVYKKTGNEVIRLLSSKLKEMVELNGVYTIDHKILDECNGCISKLEIQVYDEEKKERLFKNDPWWPAYIEIELDKICSDENCLALTSEEISIIRNKFKKFKTESPDLYEVMSMLRMDEKINQTWPSPHTVPCEIREKLTKEMQDKWHVRNMA